MSRVIFDIEFTVNGLVELIGRASISRNEAEKVQGLVDNIDTVIRLHQLQAHIPIKPQKPKKKKDKEEIEVQLRQEKSVKLSEENEDEDEMDENIDNNLQEQEEMDDNDVMMEEDPEMEIMDSDEDDNEENDSEDDEEQIMINFEKKKMTKRQLGELDFPIELPLKRPKKKKERDSTQEETLRRLDREEKRRQQMKRHIEAQKMETLDKILNQTGRKQRQRHQKESKDRLERQHKMYKTLGDVPKVVFHSDRCQSYLIVNRTQLFSDQMLAHPRIVEKPQCYRCTSVAKYKVQNGKAVCSLECYKRHKAEGTRMNIEV